MLPYHLDEICHCGAEVAIEDLGPQDKYSTCSWLAQSLIKNSASKHISWGFLGHYTHNFSRVPTVLGNKKTWKLTLPSPSLFLPCLDGSRAITRKWCIMEAGRKRNIKGLNLTRLHGHVGLVLRAVLSKEITFYSP